MKIYLAARYSRLDELNSYRKELESRGYVITARWLEGRFRTLDVEGTESRQVALWDYEDVVKADTLIAFGEQPRTSDSRGGRHVEFGIALALGKHLIIVGPRENVFHSLVLKADQQGPWRLTGSEYSMTATGRIPATQRERCRVQGHQFEAPEGERNGRCIWCWLCATRPRVMVKQ